MDRPGARYPGVHSMQASMSCDKIAGKYIADNNAFELLTSPARSSKYHILSLNLFRAMSGNSWINSLSTLLRVYSVNRSISNRHTLLTVFAPTCRQITTLSITKLAVTHEINSDAMTVS